MLPSDPAMLLSFVNMKLRDEYPDLDELCADLDISKEYLTGVLEKAGYHYDSEQNRFR